MLFLLYRGYDIITIALIGTGQRLNWRLALIRHFLHDFKLFYIVFGSVGINGAVFCVFADMYHIPDVSEPEKNRGEVSNDISAISYNVKMLKPFAYLAPETAVHYARTAESVSENIIFYVASVKYAKLIA